jgi:dienelactone hydrolase
MRRLIQRILLEETTSKVLLVFGGINQATPEWMGNQIPSRVKNQYDKIILKSYRSRDLLESIDSLKEMKNTNISVVGFSQGGLNTYRLANSGVKLDFLGLIDPSVKSDWSLKGFPSGRNSVLFYNNKNWGKQYYDKYTVWRNELAEEMRSSGMEVVEEDLNPHINDHMLFPREFFNRFM